MMYTQAQEAILQAVTPKKLYDTPAHINNAIERYATSARMAEHSIEARIEMTLDALNIANWHFGCYARRGNIGHRDPYWEWMHRHEEARERCGVRRPLPQEAQ